MDAPARSADLDLRPAADFAPAQPLTPGRLWHLQIGTFSDPEGVARIREDVSRLQLPLRVVNVPGLDLQRVLVGPFANATDAMEARVRVREAIGIEPTLVPPPAGSDPS